jgi:DNA-binding MarR family transcriptional regulator
MKKTVCNEGAPPVIPPEAIGGVISYLYRTTQVCLAKRLVPYNIGSGQFPFLMALYHSDGITQETLARERRFDKATITRAITRLEEEGYVRRVRDEDDRRAYRLFLTEKGRALEPAMRAIGAEWSRTMLAGFSEEERRAVMDLVLRMMENVSSVSG